MPYSPSHDIYTLKSNIPPRHENTIQENPLYIPSNEPYNPYNSEAEEPPSPIAPSREINRVTSSRNPLYDNPEFRLGRLIESVHRLQPRRFPTLPHNSSERLAFVRSDSQDQHLLGDPTSSELNLEASGKNKIKEEATGLESSDNENRSAADFDCNICFEQAQQPVVTTCGHLFCWPCLYPWLNVHSEHKDCPVCKEEITESNIIPIYGRGSSEVCEEKTYIKNGESSVNIPPRPRGNRFESFRQQFQHISIRFGEGISELDINNGAGAELTRQTQQRTSRILRGLIAESGSETRDHTLPNLETENANPIFAEGNTLIGNAMDQRSRDGLILPRINDMPSTFRDGPETWHRSRDTNSSANPLVNEADRAELLQQLSAYTTFAREAIPMVVGNNGYDSIFRSIPEIWCRNRDTSSEANPFVNVADPAEFLQRVSAYTALAGEAIQSVVGNNQHGSAVNPSIPDILRRSRDTNSSVNLFVNEADRAELLQQLSAYTMLARRAIRIVVGNSRYGSVNPSIPQISRWSRYTSRFVDPFVNEADTAELLRRGSAFAREAIQRVAGITRCGSVSHSIPEQVASRNNVVSTTATDQDSADSSTNTTIQGDMGVQVEPNSVGSSRPCRRREGSSASGSLDMDEILQPSKRSRFN